MKPPLVVATAFASLWLLQSAPCFATAKIYDMSGFVAEPHPFQSVIPHGYQPSPAPAPTHPPAEPEALPRQAPLRDAVAIPMPLGATPSAVSPPEPALSPLPIRNLETPPAARTTRGTPAQPMLRPVGRLSDELRPQR